MAAQGPHSVTCDMTSPFQSAIRLPVLVAILGIAAISVSSTAQSRPPIASAPTLTAPAVPVSAAPAKVDGLLGKPPPPLQVARWLKGEPVKELTRGKVWIVDFWATWCGPCKAAIPHLSELRRKHAGQLEILGISISEHQESPTDTAYIDAVRKFVDKQGDRMDYRVAVDTPDKTMHSTWFKRAGTGGIPTAFIIDQRGVVVWTGIGTPATVTRIAEAVLAGTFDPAEEAALQTKLEAEAKRTAAANAAKAAAGAKGTDEKVPGYRAAMAAGDTATALATLDAAFAADPKLEASGPYQWKFMVLMQRNKPDEVNAYVRDLLKRYPEDDDVLGFASACIVTTEEDTPRFDRRLALAAAAKTAEKARPDSRWQQFARWRYGWALWHCGERAKAIEQMSLAQQGVQRLKDKIDFGDLGTSIDDALRQFRR